MMTAILALLTKQQRAFLARSSIQVLSSDDSTDDKDGIGRFDTYEKHETDSSDDLDARLETNNQTELITNVGDMVKRGNTVDKRLINLFKLGFGDRRHRNALADKEKRAVKI